MFPAPSDELGIKDAKAVCMRCPVIQTCQAHADEHGEADGVWGGLSEDERHRFWRAAARGKTTTPPRLPQAPAPCGTEAGAKRHRRAHEPICPGCASAERQANQRRKQGVS
jgi:hypothetical protein